MAKERPQIQMPSLRVMASVKFKANRVLHVAFSHLYIVSSFKIEKFYDFQLSIAHFLFLAWQRFQYFQFYKKLKLVLRHHL